MKILQFTKKSLAYVLIAIFAIMAQFTIIYASVHSGYSYAYSKDVTTSDNMLSNPNFENSSVTSKGNPNSPSYWVVAGGDEDNVSRGVIDTSNETFNNNNSYGLTYNPLTSSSVSDSKVLMINSKGLSTRFGYKNSTEMNLSANSYYRISLLCKTNTLTNGASIYLTGTDLPLTKQYHFIDTVTSAQTDNGWATYNFYVKTAVNTSTKAYLELWLGSKQENNYTSNGQVFFDNISVQSIDQTTYLDNINSYDFSDADNMPANIRNIDLTGKLYVNQFTNSDFESGTLEGWERTATSGKDNSYSGITVVSNSSEMLSNMHLDENQTIPGSNLTYNNTKALFINHLDSDGAYTEYTSNAITIKQHTYAMITYYTKTGNVKKGGAYASVKAVLDEDDDTVTPLTVSEYTTASTGLDNYNGYTLTTIYVEGSPYRDIDITLSLGFGSASSPACGYAIFDDIAVYDIPYTTYSAATSNTIKLHKSANTSTILNGAFDYSGASEVTAYPIKPRNWTVSNDYSGIISVNKAHFDANKENYGSTIINPGPVVTYPNVDTNVNTTVNNVLMLRNDEHTKYVTATSDTFSLAESSSTVSITVYVKVGQNLSNQNSGANIALLNGTNTIAQISNIKDTEWTAYTIYLKNTSSALSLQLVLGLGSEGNTTSGYAYFDNISYKTDISADTVANRDVEKSVYTNLETNNFDSYIENNSTVHTPTTMTGDELQPSTTAGVINTSTVNNNILNLSVPTREGSNNNLLMIKNNAPTHYTYKTNYTYNFSSDNHYVISVWIYTANLSGEEEKFGVNISLSNVKDTFENVASKVEDGESVWTKYSFYVAADNEAVSSTLSISLGSEKYPTQGFVFVDSITVETIDATTYNDVKKDNYNIKTIAEVSTSTGDNETDEDNSTPYQVNYWILMSSIILALALIIAIVGVAMRHIKFRLPHYSRNKKSEYNRDNNLNNADIKRELKEIRDAKVKELDKQIEETKASMDKAKAEYEESIKGLESEQKVEKLFTKYAKNNSKLQREIDNYESAKKYITDEANIKIEEQKEIRRRQLLLEEENKLIKQNQAAIEKEKQKEKQEQEAKVEEGKKKARLKSKK